MPRTRKIRKLKRNRRHRGGAKSITIKAPSLSTKTYKYDVVNGETTARDIVQFYFDRESFIPELQENIVSENPKTTVYLSDSTGKRHLQLKDKWNEGRTFGDDEIYTIEPHLLAVEQQRLAEETFRALHWVKEFIKKMSKSGGKVILESSAATDDIPKNVRQQFHFHTNPKMSILHIDSGFFTSIHEPNQFYNMVNINDANLPEFAYGPRSLFRVYRKSEGLLTTLSNTPKQIEYLAEVERQASKKFDLNSKMLIACAKLYLSDYTENEVRRVAAEYNIPVFRWSD